MTAAAEHGKVSEHELSDNPTILLLKAWHNFLLVISRSKVRWCVELPVAHACEGREGRERGRSVGWDEEGVERS